MSLATIETYDEARWRQVADAAKQRIETRLFIDGSYVDAADSGRFITVDPANGETLAEMSEGTAADIDRAVAVAKQAFKSGV